MVSLNALLGPVNQIVYSLVLIIVAAIVFKVFTIVNDVSKISKRIETLTDVKSWIDVFKFFNKKK